MIDSGLDRLAAGVSSLAQGITRGTQIRDNRKYAGELTDNPPMGADPRLTALVAQGLRNGQMDASQAFGLISQSIPKDMASAIGQLGVQLQEAKSRGDQESVTKIQQTYNDMLDAYASAQRKLALATHIGGGGGGDGFNFEDLVKKSLLDELNPNAEKPVKVDVGDYINILVKDGVNETSKRKVIDQAVQNGYSPSQAVALSDRVFALAADQVDQPTFGLSSVFGGPSLPASAVKKMKELGGGSLQVDVPAASFGERQSKSMERLGRVAQTLQTLKGGKKGKAAGGPPAPPPELPGETKSVAMSTAPTDDQLKGFLKAHYPNASDQDIEATLADPDKKAQVERQFMKTGGK